jgi:hypothetical protein
MNDYVMSLRNIESDNEFGNDPGETSFLVVPQENKKKIKIDNINLQWLDLVVNEAITHQCDDGVFYGDILIFIPGYNNTHEKLLIRHRQLKKTLHDCGYKGTVVSFDWPSEGDFISYYQDRTDAKRTAGKLITDCIKPFLEYKIEDKEYKLNIHLLAHSTGAYVVREAFNDLEYLPYCITWQINQIMFIGADIASESSLESVYDHCDRLTNYYNNKDIALAFSEFPRRLAAMGSAKDLYEKLVEKRGNYKRAGRDGLSTNSSEKAINVNCRNYYEKTYNHEKKDQREDDGNEIVGDPSHSWYIGDKLFANDLYLTIKGSDNGFKKTRKLKKNEFYLKEHFIK